MKRREFIRKIGLVLAAGWAASRLAWPFKALAGSPQMRLALLSDAHLQDGDPTRFEALALARAVSEIRSLTPAPELILFAGDLAHAGDPRALELGKEILADLPAPLLMVRGEGDGPPGAPGPWGQYFGTPRFSHSFRGFHLLGLDTVLQPGPGGLTFRLGQNQSSWLARELKRLDSATPLILMSHAPLTQIYLPWQQWTADAHLVTPLLARFNQVICLHGHVHCHDPFAVRPLITHPHTPPPLVGGGWGEGENAVAAPGLINHQGLPATSWPLPQALQGTPAELSPGLGTRGCGWGLVSISSGTCQFHPQVWQV